ncbi:hypothetical protein ACQKOH_00005 [Sphingomonas sp. NPDC092331]|uniref:hypothetical protein n=1 Tax=unclassified Sphingomonas TaxID=196159 RepID=UPI0031F48D00
MKVILSNILKFIRGIKENLSNSQKMGGAIIVSTLGTLLAAYATNFLGFGERRSETGNPPAKSSTPSSPQPNVPPTSRPESIDASAGETRRISVRGEPVQALAPKGTPAQKISEDKAPDNLAAVPSQSPANNNPTLEITRNAKARPIFVNGKIANEVSFQVSLSTSKEVHVALYKSGLDIAHLSGPNLNCEFLRERSFSIPIYSDADPKYRIKTGPLISQGDSITLDFAFRCNRDIQLGEILNLDITFFMIEAYSDQTFGPWRLNMSTTVRL